MPLGAGGNGEATGGAASSVGSGGETVIIDGTGGQTTLSGGTILLTDEEHATLTATSCAGARTESEQLAANVELVVDTSASMADPVTGANGLSKWQVTRDALLEAVVGVTGPGLAASTQVGLLLYPLSDVRLDEYTCIDASRWIQRRPLGVAGSPQRTAIAERLLAAVPSGISSTLDAYDTVVQHDFVAKAPPGSRFVMLVTDGQPTVSACANPVAESAAEDPQPIVTAIASAYTQFGVRTIVVGTPGSEANRRWLSEAAVAGGTAAGSCDVELGNCHMDLSVNPDSLAANSNLKATVGTVPECTYQLPVAGAAAAEMGLVSVVLTSGGQSMLLLRSTAHDCSTGWQLDGEVIRLCNESCAAARDGALEILVGCVPIR